jgi:mono/diheme cytochrome c family protein
MKVKLKKVLAYGALTLVLGALVLVALTFARHDRTFDAPYPDITASQDPTVVERGRYLAFGLAHCVDCHGDPKTKAARAPGQEIALSGGHEWKLPIATVYASNITPDPETGIGRYSDKELARILRYGVHADGRAVLPFMPFANLSDEDLTAIVSFLRAQKPVKMEVPKHDVNFLGKAVLSFVHTPPGPHGTPPVTVKREATAQYGKYLAESVGNCVKCHTKLDMRTGQLAGVPFSGGAELPSETDPSRVFVSPNLTPDKRWGWLDGWSEDAFVARFHAGPVHQDSPMPWRSFGSATDDDVRAIYRYLKSLPPAPGGPDPRAHDVFVAVSTR